MEAFNLLPFELQCEVLRRLPFAEKLRLRLINQHWNELITIGMELTLVWEAKWNHQLRFLHSSSGFTRNPAMDLDRIPSVAELQQSQLAGRIYELKLATPHDDTAQQTIRDLSTCFNEVLLRPVALELSIRPIHAGEFSTRLAQGGARFRLTKMTFVTGSESASLQRIAQSVNNLLDAANHLQHLTTTTLHLATLQRVPLGWNYTLTTLALTIQDPAYGATCMQMLATGMRSLQTATFEILTELRDKRFFMPLSGHPQLRQLTIRDDDRFDAPLAPFKCELPLLATPGLLNLQTLTLEGNIRLARDPALFKRMPRLESLFLELDSEDLETHDNLVSVCGEVLNTFIDNCNAGSLPSLRNLSVTPFLGRWNPDNDDDDDDVEAWLQSPTLDFDLAQITSAAAICPRLEILKLFWDFFGDLSLHVLLPALEQCPIDYLLRSPREIKISSFQLANLLDKPQYLLDYAIGMQRTGLQRLTIHVSDSNEANRAATQRVIQNTIRLLALDVPKLSPDDIEHKSMEDEANRWSESILFFERDCGRRHELRLSTLREDSPED